MKSKSDGSEIKATLTYQGKSVDMDNNKEAEGLITEMIQEISPRLKRRSETMPEVKVTILNLENIKTQTAVKEEKGKEGDVVDSKVITKVQFDAEINPIVLARVHNLMRQGAPIYAVIGSEQAIMDFEYDRETNTVKTTVSERR